MALSPGSRIGPYEIVSPIGAGGMGEVFRARDTKLGRDVAIKSLPALFAQDPERLARLQREAQVLASLNHPNIAHVYGLEDSSGSPALVMELVPGEDLAVRIGRGPIPLREALPIARQVAQALEAAHDQGVVHRDLKPANIKVSDDGVVKVLDFGLARMASEVTGGRGGSGAERTEGTEATMTSPAMTQMGMILGTAAYMAPEQAKGRAVDRRADMWAFGVVLYEMLTGRRAFDGGDVTEVLASVIKDTPALDALPAGTPDSIRRLIGRCLQKDRAARLADAGTARFEIAEAIQAPASAAPPVSGAPPARRRLGAMAIIGGALIAAAAGGLGWWLKPQPASRPLPLGRFAVPLPSTVVFTRNTHHFVAISPDGSRVGYIANAQLHTRAIDQFESTVVPGVRDPFEVFFSPDGREIGFFADGKLQKIALTGGSPFTIAATPSPTGIDWSEDGWILYSMPGSIMRVRADGGTPEEIVKRVSAERYANPQLLPGGRAVLYTASPGVSLWDDAEVIVESLETHERTVVLRGATDARYLPEGYLVFARGGDLFGVPFDLATLKTTGPRVQLVSGVAGTTGALSGSYQYGVSNNGTLVYSPGSASADFELVLVHANGREEQLTVAAGMNYPRASPDGTRISFMAMKGGNSDVYIRDRTRGAQSPLTFEAARDLSPVWTPDSKRIVYASAREGAQNIYVQPADGTGTAERITTHTNDQYPYAVTPDNTVLYIELTPSNSYDIMAVSLSGDRTPRPLLNKPTDERRPAISPDGKWLAYQTNESSSFEVFVTPYPNVGGGRWQVSVGGGSSPQWHPNGKEIFYRQGQTIQRVPVKTEPTFSVGVAQRFGSISMTPDAAGMTYSVTPEGSVLLVRPVPGASGPAEYRVVMNWIEDVRARVK